jgi:hypothetical protein
MKKITLWLLVLLSSWQITAQVSSYVFSQTSGTYTPISGGLLLGTITSDDQKFLDPAVLAGGTGNTGVGLPIGFDFTFNGLVFDRVAVNNNGWISFGQSALTPSVDINSTSAYTPLASTAANTPSILRNRIAAIAADLEGQTGSTLRIETIGTAPNRTLVVQWTNYRRFLQTGSNLSFQIRLNETVNTVDVVFDTLTFNATSSTAHIGLGGTVSTDFDNRTTTTNWNSTISGTTNVASCTFVTGTVTPPTPGLTLTWTPGPVCAGMPTAGTSLPASLLLLPTQAVGNLVVSDYTPDVSGLTFQWEESLDNGGTWNIATGGTNATTPTYTPPVFAGTTIQYRLVVTCSATSDVAYSTVSIIQACGVYSVPVLEPLATFLPTCWQEADNGDLASGPAIFLSGSWLVDGFANSGTTGAARVTLDGAADNDWVISPLFTIPAVGYELKFDAAATQSGGTGVPTTAWESDDYVEVLVSTAMNNWTVLYTYNDTNVPSNTGAANILDLDAYSGQDVRFAFRAVEGATNGAASVDFFIDNFEIRLSPACSEPTSIVTGNITSSSLDVSWTPPATLPAVGYEYFISTVNTTPVVNGTGILTSFAQPTGLASNTTYYIFVRSDCGAGVYSAWVGPVAFTTACGTFPVPLLENFTTFLPSVCWFNRTGGDLTTGPTSLTGSGWVADGFANAGTTGAVRNEIFTTGANDWFISPTLAIPTVGYELKFDAAATQFASANSPTNAWESDDTIEVLVSTTGLTNWTPLFTYNDVNQPSNAGSPNIIDLDAYAGQNIRIAFRAVEGATNGSADIDFSIDNFQIRLTPTCVEPLNLVYSSVTTSSANISWDPTTPSPTTGYEYFVSTSNTVPVTAGTATTSTFAALSGLLPNTTYYVFVRSDCSAGDFSSWTGPISFYTGYCLPSSSGNATYVDNFSTTGGSQNISNLATGFTTGGYLNASSQFVEGYATSSFNFNAAIVGGTVGFAIWIDWNNDLVFNNATEKVYNTTAYGNGPFSGTITIPPGTALGNYRMRINTDFLSANPTNPCGAPTRAEFEDYTISVIAQPACVPPSASASGVTDVTANINWAAVTSATVGYEYVLDNVATDPAGSGTATTAITYPASGLTQLTTYYFHIRSVCSVGTYSTWNTTSFTTLATPPVNDNCASATALTVGATFSSNITDGNNAAATSGSEGAPTTCLGYSGGDIWYSALVPTSGTLTIETGNSTLGATGLDTVFTIYTGTCGALTQINCDDDGAATGAYSFKSLTGLTPGSTLLIRVYEYGNDSTGGFGISAYDASLSAASFDTSSFVAYPNPVKDVLNLSYKTAISNVKVINLLGQEVLNTKANSNDVQVNMSALTAGAYIVNITVEDTVHTIKVIKE